MPDLDIRPLPADGVVCEPGVYSMPEQAYHADPAPEPSLSRSVAHTLLTSTPAHARQAHPRLNPDFEPENKAAFDLGKAAHAVVLGDVQRFAIIDADGYQTKAAKAARDDAYAAGKTPLLVSQWERVQAMAAAARAQLDAHEDSADAFRPGAGWAELTFVWQEPGGIWLRNRIDWVPRDHRPIWEYKTTAASASPDRWGARTVYDTGSYLQSAWHPRALKMAAGIDMMEVRYVVQEVAPPYALTVISLPGEAIDEANADTRRAIDQWRWCRSHDLWPGYPAHTCIPEYPRYRAFAAAGRQESEQAARDQHGRELLELANRWQAPQRAAE